MGEEHFQATTQQAGLSITTRDVVSSEWRERWAEEGSRISRAGEQAEG